MISSAAAAVSTIEMMPATKKYVCPYWNTSNDSPCSIALCDILRPSRLMYAPSAAVTM